MSNQAQRRPSGLVTPGGGQQQGVDPELLAAIQQSQPSKEEQARIAGVQIMTQLCANRPYRTVNEFIEGAEQIGKFLLTGSLPPEQRDAADSQQ